MSSPASVLIVIIVLVACAGCRKSVQLTSGMSPTITNSEQVTINYAAYAISKPQRWDVVVFKPPGFTNLLVLKRVIALPSETVSLTASGIVVNSKVLSVPANLSNALYCPPERLPPSQAGALVAFPCTVPPKHYFVVGDNWTNSLDSRHYGAIPLTNILGRVKDK